MIFLETARLTVRRFTLADTDAMITLNGNAAVMRYLDKPLSAERVRDELMPRLTGEYDRFGGLGSFAGVHRETGAFVGWLMLRPAPESERLMEVGYRIARACWGQGYATEATRALIDTAFRHHDATRIIANTMAVNAGSRRVLEKSGLIYTHTYDFPWPEPLEGTEFGEVQYALTRDEWRASARGP